MTRRFPVFFARFARHTQGVALIEFALVTPFLLLLMLGAVELTRYSLVILKVQKSAYLITDVIAQYPPATLERKAGEINVTEVQNVMNQYERLVGGDASKRVVILTSIDKLDAGVPVIRWQQSGGGTLANDVRSVVTGSGPCGSCGASRLTRTSFGAGYDVSGMRPRENMVIGEVYYRYEPLLNPMLANLGFDFQARTVSRLQMMLPRNGNLYCLPATFTYTAEC